MEGMMPLDYLHAEERMFRADRLATPYYCFAPYECGE